MAGVALAEALRSVLAAALPGLLTGRPPPVSLSVDVGGLEADGTSLNRAAAEPRSEDRREVLPFDADAPAGPYRLPWPVLPGPREVWLVADDGNRVRLGNAEVLWEEDDAHAFTLDLSGDTDLTGTTAVAVRARAAVVRAELTATRTPTVTLESDDPDRLAAAEALVIAAVALNRDRLIDEAAESYEDGDYGAELRLDTLVVLRSEGVDERTRRLQLRADLDLVARRALRDDEGQPIERIVSSGVPDTDHPVAIGIGVEAAEP